METIKLVFDYYDEIITHEVPTEPGLYEVESEEIGGIDGKFYVLHNGERVMRFYVQPNTTDWEKLGGDRMAKPIENGVCKLR